MNRSRLLAAATATLVALTTWSMSPTATGTSATAQAAAAVDWGRCSNQVLRQAGAQCGFVTVPMDYADPAGRKLRLAVSRVRHTTSRSQGAMLINPGGPGGSGLSLAAFGRFMPRGSGASYDWIGFDPRGVGASRPALSCRPNYFHGDRPPYVPSSQAILRAWTSRSTDYAQACGAKYGALLDHMNTVDIVRDMEQIRLALGVERISFYGYSYGSYLGQVYASMFPGNVRRMVLDSNLDPRKGMGGGGRLLATERNMGLFFRWVAGNHETFRLGRSAVAVKRLYLQQRRVLTRRPAARVLGPSEWDDVLLNAAYAEAAWPVLADGFASWVHRRNPRLLIRIWRLVDTPGDDNSYAAFLATACTDVPSPDNWRDALRGVRRVQRVAPVSTWQGVWFGAPCVTWPAEAGAPVRVRGTDVPILLVGQTLDAATPFAGSLAARSVFPGSRLVAIKGGITHASTPDLSGPCANARIAAFLERGVLPPRRPGRQADVVCPAPPPPRVAPAGAPGAGRSADLLRRHAASLP